MTTTDDTGATLADYSVATRVRDAVSNFAKEAIGDAQPLGYIARLISINLANLKAMVWLPGDDEPIEVNLFPAMIPYVSQQDTGQTVEQTTSTTGSGARVWVERINDKLFVTEVFSGPTFAQAVGGFEHYTDALAPTAGTAGGAWYIRTAASASFVVPLPVQTGCVTFGPFGGALGEGFTEITISDTNFTTSKTYHLQGLATQALLSTPNYFQRVPPRYVNYSEDTDPNRGNFDLEIGNASITPDGSTTPGYYLMLRIRRTGDNQAALTKAADGYRVVIRSNGGMTRASDASGTLPFRSYLETPDPVTDTYGAFTFNSQLGFPNSGGYDSPMIDFPRRAQWMLVGGGNISWDGTNFGFTSFKCMFTGRGNFSFGVGEQYIDMPANGQAIPEYGDNETGSKTVGPSGIELLPGEALYYELNVGNFTSISDPSRFRIVNSEKTLYIPVHWLFIAGSTGTVPSLKLGTGEQYDHRRGVTFAGSWQNVDTANYTGLCYYMTAGRVVRVEGSARTSGGGSVAGDTIFTLPAGYRPNNRLIIAGVASTATASTPAAARIDVLPSGAVVCYAPSTTGISMTFGFRALQ